MPAAIPLATGSLNKSFATISRARLLSYRINCSPRYAFGNLPRWPSRTTSPLSSSMWFSHCECQREAAQKAVLGKSADSGRMVGKPELANSAPNAARCPATGDSSALSGRPSSNYYGLFPILRRLRALLQHLAVPDSAFAGVVGQLEVLGQLQRVRGTGVLAQSAEHAAAQVVSKIGEFLAAGLLVAFARDYDQVLWADQGTQVAGDAHGLVGIGI